MPEVEMPATTSVIKTKIHFELQRSDGFGSESESVKLVPEEAQSTARLADLSQGKMVYGEPEHHRRAHGFLKYH